MAAERRSRGVHHQRRSRRDPTLLRSQPSWSSAFRSLSSSSPSASSPASSSPAACAPPRSRSRSRRRGDCPSRRRTAHARLAPRPAPGPDFTRVAEQTVRAVANISSIQVVRQRTSPFFNDPFFQQFFGDPDGMFGSRDRYASSLGSGVIVSPDGYVVDQQSCARPGQHRAGHGVARRQARARSARSSAWTRGPISRCSRWTATQPAGHSVGRLVAAEGRRVGDGDRQPVSAEPVGLARHRQRARPQQRRHLHLRRLHPDRRGDQSRQLRRRARERAAAS